MQSIIADTIARCDPDVGARKQPSSKQPEEKAKTHGRGLGGDQCQRIGELRQLVAGGPSLATPSAALGKRRRLMSTLPIPR